MKTNIITVLVQTQRDFLISSTNYGSFFRLKICSLRRTNICDRVVGVSGPPDEELVVLESPAPVLVAHPVHQTVMSP
jgi:hypothetical protein